MNLLKLKHFLTNNEFTISKYRTIVSSVALSSLLFIGLNVQAEEVDTSKDSGETKTETSVEGKNMQEETKAEQVDDIELEKESAVSQISALEYLDAATREDYVSTVMNGQDLETIQAILSQATAENDYLLQEYEKEQAEAKEAEEAKLKEEQAARDKAAKEEAARQQAEAEKKAAAEKEAAEKEAQANKEKEAEEEAEKPKEDKESEKTEDESKEATDSKEDTTKEDKEKNNKSTDDVESDETDESSKENDEVTEETPEKDENKEPVERDQVQEEKEEVELPEEDTPKENDYQEEVQEETEVVEPKENIPQNEDNQVENTPIEAEPEPEVEIEPPVQNKDVKTKVSDAFDNASNTQELEKQLTDVVNQTFYLRDNQAFMKTLKVNIEDLSPEEFTYMILKQASENKEKNNTVVMRSEDLQQDLSQKEVALPKDVDSAKALARERLNLLFFLSDEQKSAYVNAIDSANSVGHLEAVLKEANQVNDNFVPEDVVYGTYPSTDTKSMMYQASEKNYTFQDMSMEIPSLNEIQGLNYIPFELYTKVTSNFESEDYQVKIQIDERIAQHIMGVTSQPFNQSTTRPYKRQIDDLGQPTNIWSVSYYESSYGLFSLSHEETDMKSTNGMIMLEETIGEIMSHYDDLESNPFKMTLAVENSQKNALIDSTIHHQNI